MGVEEVKEMGGKREKGGERGGYRQGGERERIHLYELLEPVTVGADRVRRQRGMGFIQFFVIDWVAMMAYPMRIAREVTLWPAC